MHCSLSLPTSGLVVGLKLSSDGCGLFAGTSILEHGHIAIQGIDDTDPGIANRYTEPVRENPYAICKAFRQRSTRSEKCAESCAPAARLLSITASIKNILVLISYLFSCPARTYPASCPDRPPA